MKPATVLQSLQGLEALLEAARHAAPSPLAVAAVLRAIASEAQRLQSRMEHSRQANKSRQTELKLVQPPEEPASSPLASDRSSSFYRVGRQSIGEAIEIGKRLIVLKQSCRHGEFYHQVHKQGMNEKTACRLMRLARLSSDPRMTKIFQAARNRTVLDTLLALDDDELSAIASGETVFGITLERLKTITVTEMRAKVKEIKLHNETILSTARSAKLDALAQKNKRS